MLRRVGLKGKNGVWLVKDKGHVEKNGQGELGG